LDPADRWTLLVRLPFAQQMRVIVAVYLVALALFGLPGAASAEEAGVADPLAGLECGRGQDPHAMAVLVDEAPVIDGVIDEAVWAQAEVITDLTKVTPFFCEPPTFRSEIRILTDGETLFLSMRAYDDEPDKIVRNRMARSEVFFYDDNFTVLLDTFHDHTIKFPGSIVILNGQTKQVKEIEHAVLLTLERNFFPGRIQHLVLKPQHHDPAHDQSPHEDQNDVTRIH